MRLLVILLGVVLGGSVARADTARAAYRVEGGRPRADLPFELDLVVEGFDQAPPPDQPKLEIAGATVSPLGAQPNVSRSIQIRNGRRIDETVVTWVLRWRVIVTRPGTLRVPALTVRQGSTSATAAARSLAVASIPTTDDMTLRLVVPDRPVFVGEAVPIKVEWLFRAQPVDQSLTIPLASLDGITVDAPPVPPGARRVLKIAAGTKELAVPYDLDTTTVGGVEHDRLTLTLYATPRSPGKLAIPPASVIAALRVGRPDFFGNAPTRLFRASDVARTLDVKPLPQTDRPPSFAGAVGEQFSIAVATSRSVVSLGEPVELAVTVKSDQRLDALALGALDGPGRLPKDKFTVPADPPTGELSDDGKTKTFQVIAQVTGPATEIPALAFSYFDPKQAAYQTIYSEPIALSVKGGSVVDASSVVASRRKPADPTAASDELPIDVAADLALSSPGAATDGPLDGGALWILLAALYAIPLAILGVRTWQLRTAGSREEAGEVRDARRRVEALLDRAATAPAREVAGPLVAALRELARVIDRGRGPGGGADPAGAARAIDDGGLLARLETEAFAPEAAGAPLSADLRSDAAGLVRRWTAAARRTRRGGKAASAAMILCVVVAGAAHADADPLADGRAAYQDAMTERGDTARKDAFARAAVALGEAARANPDRPELLADWGNAALASGDVATATLAYRRALANDPGNPRARRNLAFLRGRLPKAFQPAASTSATDTLLFFHRWTRARRLVVGAAAFAIAVLLVVPWTARRRTAVRHAAWIPLAIWLAMLASLALERDHRDDAIVMDGVVLRAADSAGAPAATPQPLPRGAEVTIRERRDAWTRIELPGGTSGWVPDGALARVAP